jgi:phosphoribosylformylglycinamidine cyclo-ligase
MPTYREAGVDLEAAERSVSRIWPAVRKTWGNRVVGEFGGFAAGVTIPPGYTEPVLMMSTDGVGTKADVASHAGMLDGLGFDLVAMCADDLAATGARPIAMTDYLAVGRLDVDVVASLVESIAAACEVAGMALVGGETAEHPGVMAPNQFDIAGTALGVVDRGAEIDGSTIAPGDRIIGMESPNLRSNGFSLVRATLLSQYRLDAELPGTDRSVAEEVLAPSVVYAPAIVALLEAIRPRGLAHVTGGGLPGNVRRVLPGGTAAIIDPATWPRPPVFDAVASASNTDEDELFRTFNMGIGFVVIATPGDAAAVTRVIAEAGHRAWEIGEVVEGGGEVRIEGIT